MGVAEFCRIHNDRTVCADYGEKQSLDSCSQHCCGRYLVSVRQLWSVEETYDARIAAERLNDESKKTKEIRLKLAALMRQEPDVLQHLISASNDADEFSRIVSERDQWIRETVVVLNEAGLHTDAEAFSQIRNRPQSPKKLMTSAMSKIGSAAKLSD